MTEPGLCRAVSVGSVREWAQNCFPLSSFLPKSVVRLGMFQFGDPRLIEPCRVSFDSLIVLLGLTGFVQE